MFLPVKLILFIRWRLEFIEYKRGDYFNLLRKEMNCVVVRYLTLMMFGDRVYTLIMGRCDGLDYSRLDMLSWEINMILNSSRSISKSVGVFN